MKSMESHKRTIFIITLSILFYSLSTPLKAQYWIPNFVEPEYVTISSTQGITVNSITPNHNGSYSVNIGNSNRGNQGEITSYSFEWYLSYKGERVSDYFQETIRCGQTSSRTVYCWPGEVPSGNERYVTVQLGREPARRDRRDDDY
jgi:hypothetical protein